MSFNNPPFILPCFLRIVKYIKFKEKDKILVLKFLEINLQKSSFDFQSLIPFNVNDLDKFIIYAPHEENKKNQLNNTHNDQDSFEFPDIAKIKSPIEKNQVNTAKKPASLDLPKFNFQSIFSKIHKNISK